MPFEPAGPADAMPLLDTIHDCERCYDRATFVVQDVRCVGFTYNSQSDRYYTEWAREGHPHFFCGRHKRQARQFDREAVGRRFILEHPERCREATPDEVALARHQDARRERC